MVATAPPATAPPATAPPATAPPATSPPTTKATLPPAPTVYISGDTYVCPNDGAGHPYTADYSANVTRWYWTDVNGAQAANVNPVTLYYTTGEHSYTFHVTVTANNGRTATAAFTAVAKSAYC